MGRAINIKVVAYCNSGDLEYCGKRELEAGPTTLSS